VDLRVNLRDKLSTDFEKLNDSGQSKRKVLVYVMAFYDNCLLKFVMMTLSLLASDE